MTPRSRSGVTITVTLWHMIKSEQDLIDFKRTRRRPLICLEATEYFDEFRNMSSDDIFILSLFPNCMQVLKVYDTGRR